MWVIHVKFRAMNFKMDILHSNIAHNEEGRSILHLIQLSCHLHTMYCFDEMVKDHFIVALKRNFNCSPHLVVTEFFAI